jgi:hypothetical protein
MATISVKPQIGEGALNSNINDREWLVVDVFVQPTEVPKLRRLNNLIVCVTLQ